MSKQLISNKMDYKHLLDDDSNQHLISGAEIKAKAKNFVESEDVKNKANKIIDKVSEKADEIGGKVKDLIKDEVDPDKMTVESLTLFYLSLQLIPALVLMLLSGLPFFGFIFSWFLLIGVIVIVILYFTLRFFKEKLENSSASFFIAVVLSICEGLVLSCLGSSFDSSLFCAEYCMLIAAFAIAAIFADTLGNNYQAINGQRIGLIVFANMFILILAFGFKDSFVPLVLAI